MGIYRLYLDLTALVAKGGLLDEARLFEGAYSTRDLGLSGRHGDEVAGRDGVQPSFSAQRDYAVYVSVKLGIFPRRAGASPGSDLGASFGYTLVYAIVGRSSVRPSPR